MATLPLPRRFRTVSVVALAVALCGLATGCATRNVRHNIQDDYLTIVDLVREVPEALKPRRIEIARTEATPALEATAA